MEMKDKEDQYYANQKLIDDESKSYKAKKAEAKFDHVETIDKNLPFLSNLNEDPVLNNKVFYSLAVE